MITRLQEKCSTCGKIAEELSSAVIGTQRLSFLKCGHVIIKTVESSSPFESIVFDGLPNCKHQWNKTICARCDAKRLYPFQVESAKFLERSNGRPGIFHEMGLGKTIIAAAWLKHHPEGWPFLAIVKSGIKYQWMKELVRILGIEFVCQVIQTSNDALIPGMRGYIVSYDILVPKIRQRGNKTITSGFDIDKFKQIGVKTVILDECQQIKNPAAFANMLAPGFTEPFQNRER